VTTISHGRYANPWCGPAAIALLTGLTSDQAARAARIATGHRRVIGLTGEEAIVTLIRLGFRCDVLESFELEYLPTLKRWWADTFRLPDSPLLLFLVNEPHFAVVKGAEYGDNATGGLVPFSDYRIVKRRRVAAAFTVTPVRGAKSQLMKFVKGE
jgi:hypothetical protein